MMRRALAAFAVASVYATDQKPLLDRELKALEAVQFVLDAAL
jgi:hypothetical protein